MSSNEDEDKAAGGSAEEKAVGAGRTADSDSTTGKGDESCGDISTGEGIDMSDPSTWPAPPAPGPGNASEPSRAKPRNRGEKSIYDTEGGEWRPHNSDKHHPDGHWDYKPAGKYTEWQNVYP